LNSILTRSSSSLRCGFAAAAFAGVIGLFIGGSVWLIVDVKTRLDRIVELSLRLEQLSGRSPRQNPRTPEQAARSLFLSGNTMTIAGAELEQRIKEVVEDSGGALTSSQVELDGPEAKNGFLSLTASIEVDQSGLQTILYDLEAGTPYLFVDKLAIQSPEDFGEQETARFRMMLGVVGQWRPSE